MRIRLTRDSVAAADDFNPPHEKIVKVHPFTDPLALINHIYPQYLPNVAGVGHRWECILNGRHIATVTVNGVTPNVSEVEYQPKSDLHFLYQYAVT